MKEIDDQIRALQRLNWANEQLAESRALDAQKAHLDALRKIEDKQNAVDTLALSLLSDMATQLGPKETGGRIALAFDQALTQMEQKIRTSLLGGN